MTLRSDECEDLQDLMWVCVCEIRRRRWRSRRLCTNRPDSMTEEQQRWSYRWSALVKVHTHTHTHMDSKRSSSLSVCLIVFQVIWVRWSRSRWSSASPFSTAETSQSSRCVTGDFGHHEHIYSGTVSLTVTWVIYNHFYGTENVGLFEGEARCGFLQESVRTDAVVQVITDSLTSDYNSLNAFTCTSNHIFSSIFRFQPCSEYDVYTLCLHACIFYNLTFFI